jgi:hypothetical protein
VVRHFASEEGWLVSAESRPDLYHEELARYGTALYEYVYMYVYGQICMIVSAESRPDLYHEELAR